MSYLFLFLITISIFFYCVNGDTPMTCKPSDSHYEYTECDSSGGRWRVSVPDPTKKCTPASTLPVRGKDCKFTCKPGEFLDMQDQNCKSCPAGTYSLGGGARFDEWDSLPKDFSVKTDSFEDLLSSQTEGKAPNCTGSEWTARGDFVSSVPAPCASSLVYSVSLVEPGSVSFDYQFASNAAMFQFKVQNDQCQSYSNKDEKVPMWPDATKEGEFKTQTVPLKTGLNVITWRTIGLSRKGDGKPVMIRKIEVSGVAYTSQCTKCKNGTYSTEKSEFCSPCPRDSFSGRGAASCTQCDIATEYARNGSSSCLKRPLCKERDFYAFQAPCNKDTKQTHKEYKWIKPKICLSDAAKSVKLPAQGKPEPCPPCNPGQEFVGGKCQFCGADKYSLGSSLCKPCPASTSPDYAVDYKWWNELPINMTSECITFMESDCGAESRWLTQGDHIRTHFGHGDDAYLILMLKVGGFRRFAVTKDAEVASIEFVFETVCKGKCEFIFLSDEDGHSTILKSWEGTVNKMAHRYAIHSDKEVTFTWAFEHSEFDFQTQGNEDNSIDDIAKVYSIKVTNTLDGGASTCQRCPKGVVKNSCVPCPVGHYIDPNNTSCQPCPQNTVIPNGNSWGIESCQECGPGLIPKQGRMCVAECKFTDHKGRKFDFTKLNKSRFIKGSNLFTGTGTHYYHGFNISLCATQKTLALCHNNISSDNKMGGRKSVSSMICRNTMVPDRDSGMVVATQPVSIGDYITRIVSNDINITKHYEEEGLNTDKIADDIQFYLRSDMSTTACSKGRSTIVTLQCDLKEDGEGTVDLPPKCADGTCDGCNYHFVWRTRAACPVCRKEDAEKITGECVNGEQLIHFTLPGDCILQDGKKLTPEKQKCIVKLTALPFILQVSIPVVVGFGIILFILVIYCWHKNRSLEVKYMKLVEHSGPNYDGELPGVDSCALEDGEEEQFDSVTFKESRGSKFFKKLRGRKSKDDANPFEPLDGEKIPLT